MLSSRSIPLMGLVNPVKYSPGVGMRPRAEVVRAAAIVEDAQMADERLQVAGVSGGRDDGVHGYRGGVCE
jgi:hypothetical protein